MLTALAWKVSFLRSMTHGMNQSCSIRTVHNSHRSVAKAQGVPELDQTTVLYLQAFKILYVEVPNFHVQAENTTGIVQNIVQGTVKIK